MSTSRKPDIHATFAVEHLDAGNKQYLLVVLHNIDDGQNYVEIAVNASNKEDMAAMLAALHDKCVEALTQQAKKEP